MEKTEKFANDEYVVDLSHVLKVVWRNIWIVAIFSLIVAVLGFSLAAFVIHPTYSSSVMLYVNNGAFDMGDLGFSISSSELTAAQDLAKTYTVLLKNRTTLERIIDETGVDYSWEELYDMIESSPVSETEVMRVKVTCEDPYHAERIANGIAEVLPQRIAEIIEGASMEVVDSAVVDTDKVAPSIAAYTAIGFILGAVASVAVLVVFALIDNTVHDEEYIIKTYDYPILAKVPNLLGGGTKKRYGYYYYSYKSSKEKGEKNDKEGAV